MPSELVRGVRELGERAAGQRLGARAAEVAVLVERHRGVGDKRGATRALDVPVLVARGHRGAGSAGESKQRVDVDRLGLAARSRDAAEDREDRVGDDGQGDDAEADREGRSGVGCRRRRWRWRFERQAARAVGVVVVCDASSSARAARASRVERLVSLRGQETSSMRTPRGGSGMDARPAAIENVSLASGSRSEEPSANRVAVVARGWSETTKTTRTRAVGSA